MSLAKAPTQAIDFPNFDDQSVKYWRVSPTRHSIEECFLHNFWLRENTYNHLMSQTTLSSGCSWLSLDHTFKSVSNIGSVRPADKHWDKQYSGLFCVLNADGEVLSWKICHLSIWKMYSLHFKKGYLSKEKNWKNSSLTIAARLEVSYNVFLEHNRLYTWI